MEITKAEHTSVSLLLGIMMMTWWWRRRLQPFIYTHERIKFKNQIVYICCFLFCSWLPDSPSRFRAYTNFKINISFPLRTDKRALFDRVFFCSLVGAFCRGVNYLLVWSFCIIQYHCFRSALFSNFTGTNKKIQHAFRMWEKKGNAFLSALLKW